MLRRRKSRRAKRRQAIAATLMLASLLVAVICAWRFGDRVVATLIPMSGTAVADLARSTEPSPRVQKPQPPPRPVYPYSVVSGGVYSVDELRIAMRFDPVVAAHFADFDLARTRIERVTSRRQVYVSFRAGNRVAWTSRRLTLQPGEAILTDGRNQARTRCGNRISDAVQAAVVEEEPAPEVFDTLPPSHTIPIDSVIGYNLLVEMGEMPSTDALGGLPPSHGFPSDVLADYPMIPLPGAPLVPPDVILPPVPLPPVQWSPVAVPEPGTLLLVSPALGVYALLRCARRRRETRSRESRPGHNASSAHRRFHGPRLPG